MPVTQANICAITINYWNADDTVRCIESLRASKVPVDIFVVDNSPNDPEIESKLVPYQSVTIIRPQTNLGFGCGNNLGVAHALDTFAYDYILLLNNDATISSEGMQRLLDAVCKHPSAGLITPRIVLDEDPDVLWYGGGEVNWFRAAAVVPGFFGSADDAVARKSRWVTFASGCALLFRREVWRSLKGFDPRFFMYEEDLEICLRVAESGWKIWYESAAIVRHRGQGSFRKEGGKFKTRLSHDNDSLSFFAYHIVRNRIINVRLHAKGRSLIYAMIGLPMFIIKKLLVFTIHGRFQGVGGMIRGVMAGMRA